LDVRRIPVLDAILSHLRRSQGAFHVPGHKMGRGLPAEIGQWLGQAGRLDLTEIPGLDDLHAPEGPIREALDLAAEAFGAEETYWLINGSTAGNMAMILAAARPGDQVLVPRNMHKSVLNGLVLAEADAVFYHPDVLTDFGIASGVSAATIREKVAAHPHAKAVLVTSPTYHGICSDLKEIAEIVHGAGMLLLVDEAHGAHLAFHEELPMTAMAAGADMAVQSTHKMLGSLTQTSMLHVQGPRVDRVRLRKRLQLVQSTSPSYLFLASLDSARHLMQTEGRERLHRALAAIRAGRARVKELPHLRLLEQAGPYPVDPFKWTIDVRGLGRTGPEVYSLLHEAGLTLEMCDPANVTAVFSYADRARGIERLTDALGAIRPLSAPLPALSLFAPKPMQRKMTLHDAYQRETERVPLAEAKGRAAGESVIPYPPGIPLIVPGEVWTGELISHVHELREAGVRFQGAEDAGLATVLVVQE